MGAGLAHSGRIEGAVRAVGRRRVRHIAVALDARLVHGGLVEGRVRIVRPTVAGRMAATALATREGIGPPPQEGGVGGIDRLPVACRDVVAGVAGERAVQRREFGRYLSPGRAHVVAVAYLCGWTWLRGSRALGWRTEDGRRSGAASCRAALAGLFADPHRASPSTRSRWTWFPLPTPWCAMIRPGLPPATPAGEVAAAVGAKVDEARGAAPGTHRSACRPSSGSGMGAARPRGHGAACRARPIGSGRRR